jgi:hypothetical protein
MERFLKLQEDIFVLYILSATGIVSLYLYNNLKGKYRQFCRYPHCVSSATFLDPRGRG